VPAPSSFLSCSFFFVFERFLELAFRLQPVVQVATVLDSSIGTSDEVRLLRSHMGASLTATRVSQVEKEEFPSNCCK
jgi:hypothetical protein